MLSIRFSPNEVERCRRADERTNLHRLATKASRTYSTEQDKSGWEAVFATTKAGLLDPAQADKARELDRIFAEFINIPRSPNATDLTSESRAALCTLARRELDSLLRHTRNSLRFEIAPTVYGRPRIPADEVNKKLRKANRLASELLDALTDAYPVFMQQHGFGDDEVFDTHGSDMADFHLYLSLEHPVRLAQYLTDVAPVPTEPKRPLNTQRVIAIAEIADFYVRWTGKKLTSRGNFSTFVTTLFSHVGLGDENHKGIGNLSAQIKKVISNRAVTIQDCT